MNSQLPQLRTAAALVILGFCACSANAIAPQTSAPVAPAGLTSASRRPIQSHRDTRKSWISPELARSKTPVLFVSDAGTADVYIYSVPSLNLIGTITGFSQPQGLCDDDKGNVWVTDTNAQIVYELSHRGYLENELAITAGYPEGCAWDPTTGNLAVFDLFSGSGSGNVLIYPKGSRTPTQYTNSEQVYYYFGGYDPYGDLFFDGLDTSGAFILSKLTKGSKSAFSVGFTGRKVRFPGMVQWDVARKGLLLGDQSCRSPYASCLYRVQFYGSRAHIKGEAYLETYNGAEVCDLVQGVEYNKRFYGSDYNFCGSANSATYSWPYPFGRQPTAYNDSTDSAPIGAAISL